LKKIKNVQRRCTGLPRRKSHKKKMNEWKKERKEGEIWEKEKIWVCVKWTLRFSKVH
jgi:hypothetical protein